MDAYLEYARKRDRLTREITAARQRGAAIALKKSTSNLFRRRNQKAAARIDVRGFNRLLNVDAERMVADVEGMTTYEDLVDGTLAFGLLPAVVPQLKTITIGGAVSGIGIESSSFQYGLVHETVEEMEVLLADGSPVVCSPTERSDLFRGFPNSYGTLGYALRLRIKLIPAKRYVKLTHQRFSDPERYFSSIAGLCASGTIDYLDGTIFSKSEMYVTTGEFVDAAPFLSDYTSRNIYYRSIPEKATDYLTVRDYIWRWDTDWFWCSKNLFVQNPFIRTLVPKRFLNSRTYQRVMRLSHILPDSKSRESVIQDVDIPVEHAASFLEFLFSEIGIAPIWMCPIKAYDSAVTYDLYELDPHTLYINFGFWDTIPSTHERGYHNRRVEAEALRLGGKKGLYSTAWYDEQTFWAIYNRPRYEALKARYDPNHGFKTLYEKCVQRG